MKRFIFAALAMALIFAAVFSGCSAVKPSESEDLGGNVQIPNPVVSVDGASDFETLGIAIDAPKGAADAEYSIIGGELAQITFTLDGVEYTYRAQKTDGDISGLYVEFEDEAVQVDADFDNGSVSIGIKSVKDSDAKLAEWSVNGTRFSLYAGSASVEAMQDTALELAGAQL